jgi:hypothetical protein
VAAFGLEDPAYRLTAQTELIRAIVGGRPVDQLFISLGGNDVGFTALAEGLVASDVAVTDVLGDASSFAPSAVNQVLRKAEAVIGASTPLGLVLDAFDALAAGLPADYASCRRR